MSESTETAVGFVGLGAIGQLMAEALVRAGTTTVVRDLDADAVQVLVDQGAVAAHSTADLAAQASIIGVCVPADQHVRAVLDGPDGLLEHLPAGATIGIHSTVLPETVIWAAEAAAERGIGVVEAPVTGGPMAAARGESTFLLGGDPDEIEKLSPLLDACGTVRVRAGDVGDASRLKLCLNLQTYASFMGVAEAAALTNELGLELSALKDAMRANGQLSEIIETFLFLHEPGLVDATDPAMRADLEGRVDIITKDLDLIQQLAADVDVPVPTAELATSLVRRFLILDD